MKIPAWRSCSLAACALVLSVLTGCASVTQGTEQSIKIDTLAADGKPAPGANCALSNDKARTTAISGHSALVHRSGGNLTVSCTAAGRTPASGQVISRANAGLAGNILLGGGIGAAIDVSTGAAYTYPTWLQLVFGEERLFDRSDNRGDSVTVGTLVRKTIDEKPPATATTVTTPTATPAAPPSAGDASTPLASGAGALRRGDALEYLLTDQTTGNESQVLYTVDRLNGDEISFNSGGRIEKTDGQVVSIRSPIGGYFDASSPPGGWGRHGLKPGMRWQVDYVADSGEKWRHELIATVVGQETSRVEGGDFPVIRIRYEGWIYASAGTASGGSRVGTPFEATVLYSTELGRVTRFEARHTPAYGPPIREAMALTRILR